MPPSPVMRVSPGRELKVENHKRGRSLESGILYRDKEDDLALFNEVGNKERDGFLLQPNENFDDFFSATKLRCFSGYKLGVSVPARGESSDLLNVDRDKNDYDWLITPPETPLFRSLDDEAQPVKLAPRGRPRSQSISVSRSPTMEKEYRSGRGNASPQRLSPSPRSGNSTLQSRSRPFSANHSSPPPTTRHTSPARRLSPPPTKPTSTSRSSTPAPRRISIGSIGTSAPSRVRGSSPIKTSRGNSASPKMRAWQTNIPGFSSEVPANLRTSLGDRPSSYVRGASPASRNSSRYGRQSMSPTASRSVASSHSHEQDPFSPCSKGSVAWSGDDDVDSPQSVPLSSAEKLAPRYIGSHPSNNAMSFSSKPTKKLSSSAPRRSLDLVRQMERDGPHNMFRPLLSSVPSSTFHAGKTSAHHRTLASRNSSMTTSSNASYDQAASGAHDNEGSEPNREDVMSDRVRGYHPVMDDGVFVMEHGEDDVLPSVDVDSPVLVLDRQHVCLDANYAPDTVTCSKCGDVFHLDEVVMEGDLQLCLDCRCLEVRSTRFDPQSNTQDNVQIIEHGSQEVLNQSPSNSDGLQLTCTGRTGENHLDTQNSYSDLSHSLSVELFEEGESTFSCEKVIEQLQLDGVNSSSRHNVSEGAGISLLLKRSSSVERHIVQSRIFTASSTSYDDFSYARDSLNSTRSSIERTSASVSSSIDLGSSTQTEFCNRWQSSGHKSDTENYRYETPTKLKRSVSFVSSASGHTFQVPSATPSCHEDSFEEITGCINDEHVEETRVDPHKQSLASEFKEAESICSDVESNIVAKTASVHSVLTSREQASHENTDNLMNNSHNLSTAETSSLRLATANQVDDATTTSSADMVDAAEVRIPSSLNTISENEIENEEVAYYGSHSDVNSTSELQLHDATSAVKSTSKEFEISHHAHVDQEDSRILLKDTGQAKAKSLSLEEATDVILFCSSIIHNLAYQAANFAIDNEALPVEVLRPAVTLVGKPNFERRDARLRKRSPMSRKARKESLEMETTPSSCKAETNEKSSPWIDGPSDDRAPNNYDSTKPPKLESKCNCLIM